MGFGDNKTKHDGVILDSAVTTLVDLVLSFKYFVVRTYLISKLEASLSLASWTRRMI
jgi:hypothetical protein